ncbi:MAG: bifunctional 4-hydroxy-3-methylbut-2-enyl diphosphate reductase/30S ribosomal protein S1 [Clostridia bacterium]|nr:bifunctional 4-hydroxy-3-methylbut-2-enyl diphosphate reductase/30S ribosomal protein S1 [Clostridia bacterium]
MKQVRTIEHAGFCFGVSRAVEMLEKEIEAGSAPLYTVGPIIHNPQIIEEMSEKGVRIAENVSELPSDCTAVIRAHGITKEDRAYLDEKGIRYVDATCPFVEKIHRIVESEKDNVILIGGNPVHPEVMGIRSFGGKETFVFKNVEELENLTENNPIFSSKYIVVVWQTTFNLNEYEKCLSFLKKNFENLKVYDTICKATQIRQQETAALASESDAMIIVGGKQSSNTAKLFSIAKAACPCTILIEQANEVPINLLYKERIGIAGGASTPVCIIEEVKRIMSEQNVNLVEEEMTFEQMLENSLKVISNGDRVKGIVVGVNPSEVKVDLGTKYSGFITRDNFSADSNVDLMKDVAIGDEIECIALRVNDIEGTVALSKKKVDAMAGFEKLEKACEEKATLEGKVVEVTNGGLTVMIDGSRVFVPKSLSGKPRGFEFDTMLNEVVALQIAEISVVRGRKKVIGSMRAIEAEKRKAARQEFWDNAAVGNRYNGVVKSLTTFGAFIDLGGVDGLLHITEMSWNKIKHPSDVMNVGDEVDVYIKAIDDEKKKISLGYKKAEDNPFVLFTNQYSVGDVATVKIMNLMPFGAFARIIDGVDGLIHISQISTKHIAKPADVLKVGDEVEVKIVDINEETQKVGLSIRALMEEAAEAEEALPAEEVAEVEEATEEVAAE